MSQRIRYAVGDELTTDTRGGPLLLVMGIVFIVLRLLEIDGWVLLALSFIALVMGMLRKERGWFMLMGLALGLGMSIVLIEQIDNFNNLGRVFLLCMALGYFLMAMLSRRFSEEKLWWTILPALLMWLLAYDLLPFSWVASSEGFFLTLRDGWAAVLVAFGIHIWSFDWWRQNGRRRFWRLRRQQRLLRAVQRGMEKRRSKR